MGVALDLEDVSSSDGYRYNTYLNTVVSSSPLSTGREIGRPSSYVLQPPQLSLSSRGFAASMDFTTQV